MKKAFISVVLCSVLVPISVFAAGEEYEEVLYLKNGSVIHGTIIEQVPGVSYKIKTKSGDIFVFKADEVEKITKEAVTPAVEPAVAPAAEPAATPARPAARGAAGLRKGFYGFSTAGFYYQIHNTFDFPGSDSYSGGFAPIGASFGYSLGSVFFGGGFEYLFPVGDWAEYSDGLAAVFYETRFFFSPGSSLSPFASIAIGPHFLSGDPGVMASVGGGVDYRLSNDFGGYVELGYLGVLPEVYVSAPGWYDSWSYWIGHMGVRFGVATTF